jgi:flagellar motor switch protein FliM
MQSGDVIPLEVEDSIQALVGEVPVMDCKYGIFNGQYALRVERMLTGSVTESNGERS